MGFPDVPRDQRRPFFNGPVGGYGAPFGLTTDMRYLCNCSDNNYNSLQTKLTKRFTDGYSLLATYTLQRMRNHGADQYFFDRDLEYGAPEWARTHHVHAGHQHRAALRPGQAVRERRLEGASTTWSAAGS